MPLPEALPVKLSSEEVGAISISAVVSQEMRVPELIEEIVCVTGADAARVREVLQRGTFVSGGTRFRWKGWEADIADVEAALAALPQDDPSQPFAAERCVRALLTGPRCHIEITRETGSRRPLLRRKSFWASLLEALTDAPLEYAGYDYRERCDRYRVPLDRQTEAGIRSRAGLLRYASLEKQVRDSNLDCAELYVEREG